MAYYLGTLIGTAFAFMIASLIAGLLLFKEEPPISRTWKTGLAALTLIALVAGLGNRDGEGFQWFAWLTYIPAGIIIMLAWYLRYKALWNGRNYSKETAIADEI
ncbi:MAG: hypothetical protein CL949_10090 [Erythrobacter sp.]|nr:hypothetical protein [Erythrobacter sp.]